MGDTKSNVEFWQEWDAFCDLLVERTKAVDTHEFLQSRQNADPPSPQDLQESLDMFLRLSFSPSASGAPPIAMAVDRTMLDKALRGRIADAREILTKILEREGNQNIHSQADLIEKTRLSFRELLLPSPPKPEEYTFQ